MKTQKRRSKLAGVNFGTPADSAELNVIVWYLVADYFEHRERCAICVDAFEPCPHLQNAIAAVVDWRDARHLLSLAEALRESR